MSGDRQLHREQAAALIGLALDRHRRRCRTCRHAHEGGRALCERGRELLHALLWASEAASRA